MYIKSSFSVRINVLLLACQERLMEVWIQLWIYLIFILDSTLWIRVSENRSKIFSLISFQVFGLMFFFLVYWEQYKWVRLWVSYHEALIKTYTCWCIYEIDGKI